MRLQQHGTLYQLSFLPRILPVNCYFVEEEQTLTLIDAALSYSAEAILRAAAKIGKPIAHIVITHAHVDHVGALDAIKQALPHVPVFISERDGRIMQHDMSLLPGEADIPIKSGVPKTLQTKPDILLRDGDEIGSLTAISVPGHSPGSMAFLDRRNRHLIAGDAFQTQGGVTVAGKVNIFFPFPAYGTWDKETALQSAKKLRQSEPSLLATGHGKMVPNPLAKMDAAILAAQR